MHVEFLTHIATEPLGNPVVNIVNNLVSIDICHSQLDSYIPISETVF
ncbi:hypothetical protein SAMN05216218_10384 [Halorientalis regularis]|uniref:Uncharacterized protein n=1 Tax=Halorientalis regularis TaxID=660518 RepID=A0A1G7HMZ4_9EURY|nr:hypothetical protein SAMN05216218_10384 [Halorientalis regularis]